MRLLIVQGRIFIIVILLIQCNFITFLRQNFSCVLSMGNINEIIRLEFWFVLRRMQEVVARIIDPRKDKRLSCPRQCD